MITLMFYVTSVVIFFGYMILILGVRPSLCVTVSDRSFATAGPRLWNSLPADVRSASSLTSIRQKLKTHLFRQSYPDIVF